MKILVCVTGQKTCERLIAEGARLAKEHEGTLSVLHVAKMGADFLGNPNENEAIEYLFQISASHNADMSLVRAENVMDTLAAYARKMEADMIIVGASGKGERNFARELSEKLPEAQVQIAFSSEGRL